MLVKISTRSSTLKIIKKGWITKVWVGCRETTRWNVKKPRVGSNGAVTTAKLKGLEQGEVTGTHRTESHGEQATLRGAVSSASPRRPYR